MFGFCYVIRFKGNTKLLFYLQIHWNFTLIIKRNGIRYKIWFYILLLEFRFWTPRHTWWTWLLPWFWTGFWILLNWIIIMNFHLVCEFWWSGNCIVCLLLLILVASFWFTIGVTLVSFVDWVDGMVGLWLRVADLRGAFGFGHGGFGFGFSLLAFDASELPPFFLWLKSLNCHLQRLYTYISPFNPKL